MTLKEFLANRRGEQGIMAKKLGVSTSQMSQMVNGTCAISNKRCLIIEIFTKGEVSRKDLRPNDWHEIWPELATQESAKSEEAA